MGKDWALLLAGVGGASGLSNCAEAGNANAAAATVRTKLARCDGFMFVDV
jgi:hypothetical protein